MIRPPRVPEPFGSAFSPDPFDRRAGGRGRSARALAPEGWTVLLIEDNPHDVHIIRSLLLEESDAGAVRLESAHSLQRGLERLRRGGIDIVLLDLSLPDSHGMDTFEKLRAAGFDVPVIVLTGLSHSALSLQMIRGGAEDYLVKEEINRELFLRSLAYATERHRMRRQVSQMHAEMSRNLEQMKRLMKFDRTINAIHDLRLLLATAREALPEIFEAESLSLRLTEFALNQAAQSLSPGSGPAQDPPGPDRDPTREDVWIQRALETGEPILFRSGSAPEPGPVRGSAPPEENADSVCVPLAAKGELLGTLILRGLPRRGPWPASLSNIRRVCDHLSLALYNTLLLERMHAMAILDDLTQLYNRHYFYQELDREVERAKRYHAPFSIFMMDLDGFKNLNDSFGHAVGDAALKAVARHLKSSVRPNDVVCRFGGDEFIVLLPQTRGEDSVTLAERLLQGLREPIAAKEESAPLELTASCGIAEYVEEETVESFLRRADAALYEAKKAGRNTVRFLPAGASSGD